MFRSLSLQSFVTNVAILGLGLAGSVMLARWLLPTGRGEVAAAMLWPVFLTYLGSLGLIDAIIYYAALPGAHPGHILTNGMVLALLQSAILVPLGFVLLPRLLGSQRPEVVMASRLYLLVIPLTLVGQYGSSLLQGRMRIGSANGLRLIIPVGYLLGAVVLHARARLTIANIIALHLSLNVLIVLCMLLLLWRSSIYPPARFDLGLARELLGYGLKVYVGNLTQGANARLDQLLMAAWVLPDELGLYVAAVSASGLTQALTQAVKMVITPSIAQLDDPQARLAHLRATFQRYWLLSLLLSLPLAVALFWALPLVFGAAFGGAVWPAEVLLLGGLFQGAKEVLAAGTRAMGDPLLGSRAETVAFVVTVILLALLLPRLGIMGAALASLGAYITSLGVMVAGVRRYGAFSVRELFRIDAGTVRGLATQLHARLAR